MAGSQLCTSAGSAGSFIVRRTDFSASDTIYTHIHMVAAETFVNELDAKNQPSIQRVIAALNDGLGKEGVEVADTLRIALKAAIELAEVAALWVTDCDDLEMKLSLAEQCGDGARQCRRISARLVALGVADYDPRNGGYSKLFAFLRSLQTPEERSSAGYLTGKALSMARLGGARRLLRPEGGRGERPAARRGDRRGGASLLRGGASAYSWRQPPPRRARPARVAPPIAPSSWPARRSSLCAPQDARQAALVVCVDSRLACRMRDRRVRTSPGKRVMRPRLRRRAGDVRPLHAARTAGGGRHGGGVPREDHPRRTASRRSSSSSGSCRTWRRTRPSSRCSSTRRS